MFREWFRQPSLAHAARSKGGAQQRAGRSHRALHIEQLEARLALTVIAPGDGQGNGAPPPDDPGYANVGYRGSGSAVYLGDNWVITAVHVGAGDTMFGTITYTMVPGSAVQLTNPQGVAYTPGTDLVMYKINGSPNLPSLWVNDSTPAVGWQVTMIGAGRDRNASEAYWDSNWAPSATPSTYSGYIWAASQWIRWGTNVIDGVNVTQGVQSNSQVSFYTTFTDVGGLPDEGQGAVGDSGGAVFHKDAVTGQWELTGLMFSITNVTGQPWGTSVFGDRTYSADLFRYRSQILATMGINDAPSGTSKTVATLENTPYTFTTADFGFGDPLDTPADAFLSVKITTIPAAGSLTNNGAAVIAGQFVSAADIAAGLLRFTPGANASGASYASFNFQVQDDGGTTNGGLDLDPSPNTITINVTPVDTTRPVVSSITPADGVTNVAITRVIAVVFNEVLNASTVTSNSVQLLDGNTIVAAAVSYGAETNTVTVSPTASLDYAKTYTVLVRGGAGGVQDLAGNTLAANVTTSFATVAPPAAPGPASLWGASATPAVIDSGDGSAIELGVQFSSNSAGYVTSVRFYKAAANTGSHTGSLWSSTGQLLATGTFTGETASGWQQLDFATPVAIAAGATYVASYHTNAGHYSVNRSAFNVPYANGSLQVVVNGGVFLYGAGGFPTQSYLSSNFWVDVVVSASAPVDTTAPTVISTTPAGGETGVLASAVITIAFNEALSVATVTSSTVRLLDGNNIVAATVAYDANTNTVTLTPNAPLANVRTYTISVIGGSGGIKDVVGNPLAASVTSSFTTATGASLWGASATPAVIDGGDGSAIELGVKFSSATSGYVTSVRFYKAAANTGTHTGSLWSLTGQLLATGTFSGETASGWQQLDFATPVAISAGATYVASYHTNSGHFSVTRSAFGAAYTSGSLQVPVSGGVFLYGTGGLPTQTYMSSNFWVDVVVSATAPPDTTPPLVTGTTPAAGATGVPTGAAVSVTFSEVMNAATITTSTVRLLDGSNAVAATVAYNASTRTATLTPTAALASAKTYTLSVTGGASGIKDLAGNALAATATSTFTTASSASSASLWGASATPAVIDSGDGSAIELGVQFSSNSAGYVTSVRFYKAAANTGSHTGSLWSSTGQLLATGTFTGETASGWQQLDFATPVAIAAGATYVASYHTNAGHYSVNRSAFNVPYANGSLQVVVNGGVFLYGAGGFPTQSYLSSNFWVDVVVSASAPVDTTAPTVISTTPAAGSAGVSTGTAITITVSESLSAASVTASTVRLLDGSSTVAATLSYSGGTTITLTPTSALAISRVYSIVITGGAGGVRDVAGNALAVSATSSFTTEAVAVNSFWTNANTPSTIDSGDAAAIELGVKFTADVDGFISGVRYYKSAANTGTHVANLWSASGALLATATFVNETASGWQTAYFSSPVAITAGQVYTASYFTSSGHYAVSRNFFTSQLNRGPLHAQAGVFRYGATSVQPTQAFQASNYWVDVLFSTGG